MLLPVRGLAALREAAPTGIISRTGGEDGKIFMRVGEHVHQLLASRLMIFSSASTVGTPRLPWFPTGRLSCPPFGQ